MEPSFRVTVRRFSILREIEGARTAADYAALLDAMEFGDTSGMSAADLCEMCVMSLQDLEPEAAATVVLEHDLGDRLSKGQIHHLANEHGDDKPWEQHADMALHERLFTAGALLYRAFPSHFPEPDAVRLTLEVAADNEGARQLLTEPLSEALVVRLLAHGMDDTAVLHRMFDAQLAGGPFPEAETIVWIVRSEGVDADTVILDVTSSGYWLDALRETRSYGSIPWS